MSRILTALKRIEQQKPAGARAASADERSVVAEGAAETALPLLTEPAIPETSSRLEVAAPPGRRPHNPPPLEISPAWPGGLPAQNGAPKGPAVIPLPQVYTGEADRSSGRRASDRYMVAPEYAALCERILSRLAANRAAAILILPADASADASTIVAELALSMAQMADERVLAIDADLAGAHLASKEPADAEAAMGLSEVLAGNATWEAAVAGTRDRRVQLLAAGKRLVATGGPILPASKVGPLLAEIKGRYRLVLVHAGEVAGPLDAPLAKSCDLAYLVVHQGHTSHRAARRAKRRLELFGGALHGCIVTQAAQQ